VRFKPILKIANRFEPVALPRWEMTAADFAFVSDTKSETLCRMFLHGDRPAARLLFRLSALLRNR
jgi:hypothetical protein